MDLKSETSIEHPQIAGATYAVARVGRGKKLHLVWSIKGDVSLCGAGNNRVYSRVHRTGGPLATVNCKACASYLQEWTSGVSIVAREGDTVLYSDGRMIESGVTVGTVRHWPE